MSKNNFGIASGAAASWPAGRLRGPTGRPARPQDVRRAAIPLFYLDFEYVTLPFPRRMPHLIKATGGRTKRCTQKPFADKNILHFKVKDASSSPCLTFLSSSGASSRHLTYVDLSKESQQSLTYAVTSKLK